MDQRRLQLPLFQDDDEESPVLPPEQNRQLVALLADMLVAIAEREDRDEH